VGLEVEFQFPAAVPEDALIAQHLRHA